MKVFIRHAAFLLCLLLPLPAFAGESSDTPPNLAAALASKPDLYGEAAMRQPNGASYEFFAPLLPPPRYVNADFHYYPIVLSAPNAKVKARLISNGSGVNLRGGARSWNDNGLPFIFRVGPDEFLFGSVRDRLSDPTLAEGYLPIVSIRYRHPSPFQAEGEVPIDQKRAARPPEIYELEAFAATDEKLAENGVVFVKFSLVQGTNGYIAVDPGEETKLKFAGGIATDDQGKVMALFDKNWKRDHNMFAAHFKAGTSVVLAIPTRPLEPDAAVNVSSEIYKEQRDACAKTWRNILARGMNVETPEPLVNNAWRSVICQNFELINGDSMRYSAGNQYDRIYEAEGSDAAMALMMWGYESDMRRLMVPLFDFTRKGLEFHQASCKLVDLCRYYWQTRDAAVVNELRSRWEKEAQRLDENRTGPDGLYPKEQYCGDIHTYVLSLNACSTAWRAMRDLGAVLAETGNTAEAKHYSEVAAGFRKTVLDAIDKSARRDISPPFVPIALLDHEPIHDPICDVRIGSYWNIIIGYTIASGIFPPGGEEENWIPHYQEQHGGLCMGMLRSGGDVFNFWTGEYRVNPLYGTRYSLDALRRDDVDRALVSFYGMLAQGFTRNTFVCGEGCSLMPVDNGGRIFYCPPNSAANAHFLSMLRSLLVQECDTDDDGVPDTLRLLFATPKRWLEDGKSIKVERAPTVFGPVSLNVQSKLNDGEVIAEVDLPQRQTPKHTLLRVRVPDGWRVISAQAGSQNLAPDAKGTVDISTLKGKVSILFRVEKA
jgi:hypothetical protein